MYISSCKERREKIKKKTNKERKKIDRPTISGNRELIICDSSFILIVHFLQYNFESYNTTIYSNDRHASRNACQIRRFIIKGGGKRGKEEKNNDAFDSLTRFLSLLSLSLALSLSHFFIEYFRIQCFDEWQMPNRPTSTRGYLKTSSTVSANAYLSHTRIVENNNWL